MAFAIKENILWIGKIDWGFSKFHGEEYSTGQHIASELMYNDLVNQGELFQEAIKYYANILTHSVR